MGGIRWRELLKSHLGAVCEYCFRPGDGAVDQPDRNGSSGLARIAQSPKCLRSIVQCSDVNMHRRASPSAIDVIDVMSPNFDKGPIELNSDVTMVRTHADGLADFRSVKNRKALSCLHTIFIGLLATQLPGVKATNLRTSDFRPPGSLPNEFGLQLSLTLTGEQNGTHISIPVSVREIGFLVDRAEAPSVRTSRAVSSQFPMRRLLSIPCSNVR